MFLLPLTFPLHVSHRLTGGENRQHQWIFHLQPVQQRVPQLVWEAQIHVCLPPVHSHHDEWEQNWYGEQRGSLLYPLLPCTFYESALSLCGRLSGATCYLEGCPSKSCPTQQWVGCRNVPGLTSWPLALWTTSETWQRASPNICRGSRGFLTATGLTGTHR